MTRLFTPSVVQVSTRKQTRFTIGLNFILSIQHINQKTITMNVETFDDPSPIGLTLSQSFTKTSLPSASTPSLTDSYILHIATLNNSYATSLSAPSNSIAIFDKSRLYPQATFKAHSDAITLIRSSSLLYDGASSSGGSTLLSSGKDGFIKVWDERRGSESVLKCQSVSFSLALAFLDIERIR